MRKRQPSKKVLSVS